MRNFFPNVFLKEYSVCFALVIIFVHSYVLGKDMECSCEEDTQHCSVYMLLPFFVLIFLQLCTDGKFKRTYKYSCPNNPNKFLPSFSYHIMKAVCIGLLWVLCVLINGDWYVCCCNSDKNHPKLACKDEKNMTDDERVTIAKLKNTSLLIALSTLLGGLFVFTFVMSCGWRKYCEHSSRHYRKRLYDQLVLEEEGKVLTEILRKAAKENLENKMQRKLLHDTWWECFDVAEELIKDNTPPVPPVEKAKRKLEDMVNGMKRKLEEKVEEVETRLEEKVKRAMSQPGTSQMDEATRELEEKMEEEQEKVNEMLEKAKKKLDDMLEKEKRKLEEKENQPEDQPAAQSLPLVDIGRPKYKVEEVMTQLNKKLEKEKIKLDKKVEEVMRQFHKMMEMKNLIKPENKSGRSNEESDGQTDQVKDDEPAETLPLIPRPEPRNP